MKDLQTLVNELVASGEIEAPKPLEPGQIYYCCEDCSVWDERV